MGKGTTGRELLELKESSGGTYAEVGAMCGGMTADTVRGLIRRYKARQRKAKPHNANGDVLTNLVRPEAQTMEACFDVFRSAKGASEKHNISQTTAEITINTDKPIAISIISDAHIGSKFTDYDALEHDLNTVRDTDGLYCLIGGDFYDNFTPGFKDASAVTGQIQDPKTQLLIYETILKEMEPSIIAIGSGNHNSMSTRKTGVDTEYFVIRGIQKPYLPTGGLLKVHIGDQTYGIIWKHQYRFNSALNKFNAHHRMREMLTPDIDVAILEHEHSPGVESIVVGDLGQRRTVVNIRAGSYKIGDPFSRQFFAEGEPGPQTFFLWPDRHKVLAMHGADALNDAVDHLRGINAA